MIREGVEHIAPIDRAIEFRVLDNAAGHQVHAMLEQIGIVIDGVHAFHPGQGPERGQRTFPLPTPMDPLARKPLAHDGQVLFLSLGKLTGEGVISLYAFQKSHCLGQSHRLHVQGNLTSLGKKQRNPQCVEMSVFDHWCGIGNNQGNILSDQ